MSRIDLLQIAYTSEWALAKFFPAIFKYGLSDYFNLVGICGREKNKDEVRGRLLREIENRTQALREGKTWRIENIIAEMDSCNDLLKKLANNEIRYFPIKNGNLPTEVNYDAAAIFTTNPTHIAYIEQLSKRNVHILCEKPLVIVTNKNHEANKKQLKRLENLVEKGSKRRLIMMDAEHYSAKKATITFFERIGDIVANYGKISKIEACTEEKDDPEKPRTRKILCRDNRTGLLLDMSVHLFGIVTNIGGNIEDILTTKYDIYPGHNGCPAYDVETYIETEFEAGGELFHDDAKGKFTFAKFIHKFREQKNEDKKQVKVTFEKKYKNNKITNKTVVTIDFRKGTVEDDKKKTWYSYSQPLTQEYVNILKDFYNSIIKGQAPRTSFERSIKNLKAIYQTYEKFPVNDSKNQIKVYEKWHSKE